MPPSQNFVELIELDRTSAKTMPRQLYSEFRRLILTGKIPAGTRLPSSRDLSKELQIARSTVIAGYDQLLKEGYIQTFVGTGTIVARHLPDEQFKPLELESVQNPATGGDLLSRYGRRLAERAQSDYTLPYFQFGFDYGRPDLNRAPLSSWRDYLLDYVKTGYRAALDYNVDPLGFMPLREAISKLVERNRSITVDPKQIAIVSGSQQGINLLSRLLIDEGDLVAMENPGNRRARRSFLSYGAKLFPLSVDRDGLCACDLDAIPGKPKLIYATPSHQFPTGAVLSIARRTELLQKAYEAQSLIIEDDYDGDYQYGSNMIAPLKSGDSREAVAYIGTFSNVMFPSLRLAFVALPSALVAPFRRAKALADAQSPLIEQHALAQFINDGQYEIQMRGQRLQYQKQRRAVVRACLQYLGGNVNLLGEDAGLHVMVRFKTSLSDRELMERFQQAEVRLTSTKRFYIDEPADNSEFVLGFGDLSEKEIDEGISRIAEIFETAENRGEL
jgi:GntR family transcriptional regulator / MocR family aminotransferase